MMQENQNVKNVQLKIIVNIIQSKDRDFNTKRGDKMNIQEMQELLDKTEDKFSVFADRDKLKNSEFSVNELVDVIYKYLSEDEIVNLFSLPHFKTLKPNIKYAIIKNLSDQNKYNLLFNSDFIITESRIF